MYSPSYCNSESLEKEAVIPRGDKSAYTVKQKRQAEHIEEGYEKRGTSHKAAERRTWATVNKESGGGKKSGSGRGKKENHAPSRKGGRIGGSSQSTAKRSAAAKKGWATRRRQGKGLILRNMPLRTHTHPAQEEERLGFNLS